MSFATILPLAIVMVVSPQLPSAIFLATSTEWRRNSLGFVALTLLLLTLPAPWSYW